MKNKPDFNLSPTTKALIECLQAVPTGDTITYDQITNQLNSPREKWETRLNTAKKHLTRDFYIVFETLRNVGFRRLPPKEQEIKGEQSRKSIHRKSKKTMDELIMTIENYDQLSGYEKARLNAERTIANFTNLATSPKTQRQIQKVAIVCNDQLPSKMTAKILEGLADDKKWLADDKKV